MALEVEDEQIVWPGGSRLAVETMIMRMAPIIMRMTMTALKIMRMKMTVPMIMRMTMSALMTMLMTTNRKTTTTTTIIKRATLIITRKRPTAIIYNDFDGHNNINNKRVYCVRIPTDRDERTIYRLHLPYNVSFLAGTAILLL